MHVLTRLAVVAGAGCLILATAGPASAGDGSVRPNYRFPSGDKGFALKTHGGPLNPGVLVGFNPQPDPPAEITTMGAADVLPTTFLNLRDPTHPLLENAFIGDDFGLHFWIVGHGFEEVAPPPAPNTDGVINFRHVLDGHVFDIAFNVGPNQVDPRSWRAFDPQPDPPGVGFGVNFSFTEQADPFFGFTISLDGQQLSFSAAPEPATWALLILGFGGAGVALRRRRALTA